MARQYASTSSNAGSSWKSGARQIRVAARPVHCLSWQVCPGKSVERVNPDAMARFHIRAEKLCFRKSQVRACASSIDKITQHRDVADDRFSARQVDVQENGNVLRYHPGSGTLESPKWADLHDRLQEA